MPRYTAIYGGMGFRGHIILFDPKGPGIKRSHCWINGIEAAWFDGCKVGQEITLWATLKYYRSRRHREFRETLRDIREVK